MALGDHNAYYAISPLIGVLPRYYDDRKRRAKMGKNTYGNSANFLAVDCVYYFDPVWKGYREGRSKSYVFFLIGDWEGLQKGNAFRTQLGWEYRAFPEW